MKVFKENEVLLISSNSAICFININTFKTRKRRKGFELQLLKVIKTELKVTKIIITQKQNMFKKKILMTG